VGHAFYWNRLTGMLDLNAATSSHGTPGVDYFDLTKASAINLHHRIVGYAISWDTNVIRAFMLERTSTAPSFRFENLGTFTGGGISLALAINRGWTAVGAAYLDPSGTGNYRAALFSNGRVVDLNSLLAPFEPGLWRLREATGINDNGEIVGWGESLADNGRHHAFKLTPRAHLELTAAEPADDGTYRLGVDGAGFTLGGQVQIDVRAHDIGGTLIRSGVRTASGGRVTFGARVPCDTNLVVNARDVATEAYSNAVSAYIACQ
jgi:probable HAF family extracellular repeat protein